MWFCYLIVSLIATAFIFGAIALILDIRASRRWPRQQHESYFASTKRVTEETMNYLALAALLDCLAIFCVVMGMSYKCEKYESVPASFNASSESGTIMAILELENRNVS